MGIGTTFFTLCSPQNKAPQGPWLRHGPCGAPPRAIPLQSLSGFTAPSAR